MLHAFHIIFYLKGKICRRPNFALKEMARKGILFFFPLRPKRGGRLGVQATEDRRAEVQAPRLRGGWGL